MLALIQGQQTNHAGPENHTMFMQDENSLLETMTWPGVCGLALKPYLILGSSPSSLGPSVHPCPGRQTSVPHLSTTGSLALLTTVRGNLFGTLSWCEASLRGIKIFLNHDPDTGSEPPVVTRVQQGR